MNIDLIHSNKVYFNTYTSICRLVENSFYLQHEYNNSLGVTTKSLELCTIRASSGRRAGHTSNILRAAIKLFDRSVIICRRMSEVERVRRLASRLYPEEAQCRKFEIESIVSIINMRGIDYRGLEAVFVDSASLLTDEELQSIYSCFMPYLSTNPYYFFILVG